MMQLHWTQHDLLINGVKLHYHRTAQGGKRPLVLVHGFSDNGLCWTPVAHALESDYDIIMPDMRGHGLSARVKPGEKVDMAADLAGLIRVLDLKNPIVCGHSMGAMVTFQLGVQFPELASVLVLEDPPWWFSQTGQTSPNVLDEAPIVTWAKSLANQTLDDLLTQTRKEHPDWPESLVIPMGEAKKQLDQGIIDTMTERMNAQQVDWQTRIQDITHPVLLITGNPELGGIVTSEVVAKVRQLNPAINVVTIPDAGHLIRFDKYTAFMDALRIFLKQVS